MYVHMVTGTCGRPEGSGHLSLSLSYKQFELPYTLTR